MMTALLHLTALAVFFLLPFTAACVAAEATAGDNAIINARMAFLAGDITAVARAAEKTGGHLLEAYPRFWLLSLKIAEAEPAGITAFLEQNAGTVLAERLRQAWLRELAKQHQWDLFHRHFPLLARADSDNRCWALQERMLRNGLDDQTAAWFRSFWNAPRPLPVGCLPVAKELVASGRLVSGDIRDRLRLLFRNNLGTEARRTVELYTAEGIPDPALIEKIFRDPAGFLERYSAPLQTPAGSESVLLALLSLSRSDLTRAADFLKSARPDLFALQDRQLLWAHFALLGARRHRPEALEWFGMAGAKALSGEQLEWLVRIALREGNWPEAKNAIMQMPVSLRNETAWTYWLGRSLCAAGKEEEGRKLFEKISRRHDFYGLLAAEELDLKLKIPPETAPPTEEELARISGIPGIKRALALYRLKLRPEAFREWQWCVRTMNDRQLLAAAQLAAQNGLWDRAVNAAIMTAAKRNFSLRYPFPFRENLAGQARVRNLNEAFVLGLVRQESLFDAEARSSAGAIGLMQLMPETARIEAGRISMKGYSRELLARPEINTALGTSYLRHILDSFSANYAFAAAAYNAGPHRAKRWRNSRPLEGAIYVESIPFTETRNYVKKVMANTVFYSSLSGEGPLVLKALLGTVESNAVTEAEAGR